MEKTEQGSLGGKFIDGAVRMVTDRLGQLPPVKQKIGRTLLGSNVGLRVALLLTTLASAGCSDQEVVATSTATAAPQGIVREIPTPVPTVEPTATPIRIKELDVEGLTLLVRGDGLDELIGYRDSLGRTIKFNQKEMEEVLRKAAVEKEPQLFHVIELPVRTDRKPEFSLEHPVRKDLPNDVLSARKLKEKGVEIMQSDNTDLYIREGAFEEGGPLADYAKGEYNLKIVLLNSPILSEVFMRDPKYKEIKDIFLGKGTSQEKKEIRPDLERYR